MNQHLFLQAARLTVPVFFGYIAIGIPFGLMIVNAGYPWWIAPLMSLFMYAGAGQYIAVGLFAAGLPLTQILVTELFVNIRHIVYGLSLIDKFKAAGKWKPYLIFALTDETYAILTSVDLPKGAEAGPFFGTIAMLDHLYWILGSVIGAAAYSVLEHYKLSGFLAGVDFALTALFVVILIEQIKKSKDFVPPLIDAVAGLAAVVLSRAGILPSSNIILVAIVFALAAILIARGRKR
jgi:4-azaleucine resistance transporter AzlC